MGKELFHCSKVEFFEKEKRVQASFSALSNRLNSVLPWQLNHIWGNPFANENHYLSQRPHRYCSRCCGTVPMRSTDTPSRRCVSEDYPTISRAFRGKLLQLLPGYSARFQSLLPLVNLTNNSVVSGRKELFKVLLPPHGSIHNVHQQLTTKHTKPWFPFLSFWMVYWNLFEANKKSFCIASVFVTAAVFLDPRYWWFFRSPLAQQNLKVLFLQPDGFYYHQQPLVVS